MRVVCFEDIERAIDLPHIEALLEQGFVLHSKGQVVTAAVQHLQFENPPGDCHVKSGYIADDEIFVVKVATGFYSNYLRELPNNHGMSLVMSRHTGEPVCLLDDRGYLTDLRTALAGKICAKYLAPKTIYGIGILGTGVQARLQLQHLLPLTACRMVHLWGRNVDRVNAVADFARSLGCEALTHKSVQKVFESANLVVSTTASIEPIISVEAVRPGIHITGVGADGGGKNEIAAAVFSASGMIVVDCHRQCSEFGDLSFALKCDGAVGARVRELGSIIENGEGRKSEDELTIADLTGLAVQDVQIAKSILSNL